MNTGSNINRLSPACFRCPMKLVRFVEGAEPVAGLVVGNEVHVYDALGSDPFAKYMLLKNPDNTPLEDFLHMLIEDRTPRVYRLDWVEPRFIMPMVPSEVWISGVTYKRSAEAREEETESKGIYDMVYNAKRPEITLKGTGYRTAGPNDVICIRSDSNWNVPEPEFTLVFGEKKIVAYTIGNDVSSRDIEGENPLYLPQAKVFRNSCAIGPYLATASEIKDPRNVGISIAIHRDSQVVFSGETSTSNMKRTFQELQDCLFKDNPVPRGSILLTGVGIVPPDDFTLKDGDIVEISIDGLGTMRNHVKKL
ncbi:MAG: fumarylacetoacetate hydrolase [Candidatus Thorarchaeota archaeon]|nr:fumarylacetoacetate hydrolase [Candidatus Thorarchaeota archaeon]